MDLKSELSPEGLEFYNKVETHLSEHGMYQDIDETLVFQAAVMWENFLDSVRKVKEYGTIITAKTGYIQVSPHVTNMHSSSAKLEKTFKLLGIGEEARAKLNFGEMSHEADPMDDL